MRLRPIVMAAAVLFMGAAAATDTLDTQFEAFRAKHNVPAVAGLVWRDGEIVAQGQAGVRAAGDDQPVQATDAWHLGSNTKFMTSVLIARLVERGQMRWDMTVGEAFPELIGVMQKAFEAATLTQLLSHTSGLQANIPLPLLALYKTDPRPIMEQRQAYTEAALKQAPAKSAGEFEYSNNGYVVAGRMAERVTGKDWETLMREEVFAPLSMASAGFGPMGTDGTIDAIRGHARAGGKPAPFYNDNPAVLGPAGRVHVTLADWAKFAAAAVEGARGGGAYLKPESWTRLLTPVAEAPQSYALGMALFPPGLIPGATAYAHEGNNTLNHAMILIAPEKNAFALSVTNDGEGRPAALDAMNLMLVQYVLKDPAP